MHHQILILSELTPHIEVYSLRLGGLQIISEEYTILTCKANPVKLSITPHSSLKINRILVNNKIKNLIHKINWLYESKKSSNSLF